MHPLLPLSPVERPWHSSQYASLPEVYVQNGSLEIAWCRVVFEERTIAGNVVLPFLTRGHEGLDLNRPVDWQIAEQLVRGDPTLLPRVAQLPWSV